MHTSVSRCRRLRTSRFLWAPWKKARQVPLAAKSALRGPLELRRRRPTIPSRSLTHSVHGNRIGNQAGSRHAAGMLRTAPKGGARPLDARVAIVASRYNPRYVNALVRAAKAELAAAGARVTVIRVPGAFEIPVAAAALLAGFHPGEPGRPEAVIALGLIWQGETSHADQIGGAVTDALMRLSVNTQVPMIHEVITVATADQARARCLDPETNRGLEAARTALEMARLLRTLTPPRF